MEMGGKIITGAVATVVLTLAGHYATGDRFISGLENTARTELTAQGMDAVSVSFPHDPLSRKALLEGDVSGDIQQQAVKTVSAIPGVSNAYWADDERTADPADALATETVVKECQGIVDKAIEGKKLSFRSGSAYISPVSNKILDEVAAAFKPCTGLMIAVGGHTDDAGDAEVNAIMSQERADRVRAGLIERGIPENLVTATGYGATQPLAKGSGAEADAQNRRIEFKVSASSKLAENGNK
ncbi:OmpA family protein [Parasphingorhabdus sp. JC815]|uniref:OmpA family protein n=1 Tax=Parasphingorhabdus sp. JC815 TaxID=3232140 RepID=UPI003459E4F3